MRVDRSDLRVGLTCKSYVYLRVGRTCKANGQVYVLIIATCVRRHTQTATPTFHVAEATVEGRSLTQNLNPDPTLTLTLNPNPTLTLTLH